MSFFLKTSQISQHSIMGMSLKSYSGLLPRWGTMWSGAIYEHQILGSRTSGNAGLLWPTISHTDGVGGSSYTNALRAESGERRQSGHKIQKNVEGLCPGQLGGEPGKIAGAAQRGLGRDVYGVSGRMDESRIPSARGCKQFDYEPPRTKTRQKGDMQRIRTIGNSILPQAARPLLQAVYEWLNHG